MFRGLETSKSGTFRECKQTSLARQLGWAVEAGSTGSREWRQQPVEKSQER